MAQAPHDARAGLTQAQLNGSCLGPARQTRLIWPSIPSHLSCHHLVRHSTSFLSPLMPPSPRHPILGKGRRSRRLLPYSPDTSPDTDSRSDYCMSTRTLHIMRAPSFSPSPDVPFVFSAFALFFLPNMLPSPTVVAASRPTLIDVGTGRVGHAPGLSPCVPSRRTWWRLPRLSYFSDEKFKSEILDN
jgi:hypothetical protein